MTKRQFQQLERLCGKVEALQNQVKEGTAQSFIAKAKNSLLDAIRAAEAA